MTRTCSHPGLELYYCCEYYLLLSYPTVFSCLIPWRSFDWFCCTSNILSHIYLSFLSDNKSTPSLLTSSTLSVRRTRAWWVSWHWMMMYPQTQWPLFAHSPIYRMLLKSNSDRASPPPPSILHPVTSPYLTSRQYFEYILPRLGWRLPPIKGQTSNTLMRGRRE